MPRILGPNPDMPGSVFVETDDGRIIPVQEELANELVLGQKSPGPTLTADDVMGQEPQQPEQANVMDQVATQEEQDTQFASEAAALMQATEPPPAGPGGMGASEPFAQQGGVPALQGEAASVQQLSGEEQALGQALGQGPTEQEVAQQQAQLQTQFEQQTGEAAGELVDPQQMAQREQEMEKRAAKQRSRQLEQELSEEEVDELMRQQGVQQFSPTELETMRERGVVFNERGQKSKIDPDALLFSSPGGSSGVSFRGFMPSRRQTTSKAPIDPEVLSEILSTQEGIRDIMGEVARLKAEGLDQQARVLEDAIEQHQNFAEEFAANEDQRQEKQDQALALAQSMLDSVRQTEIDPNNFFASRGEGTRFATAINVAAGQLAATVTNVLAPGANATNTALQIINDAIERDFAAQKANLDKQIQGAQLQQNLLGRLMALVEDERQAELLHKSMMAELAAKKLEQSQILSQSDQARANGTLMMEQLKEQQLKWLLELQQNSAQITSVEQFVSRGGGGGARRRRVLVPTEMGLQPAYVDPNAMNELSRTEQEALDEVSGSQLGRFIHFPKGKPTTLTDKQRQQITSGAGAMVNIVQDLNDLIDMAQDEGVGLPALSKEYRARANAIRLNILSQLNQVAGGSIQAGGGVLRESDIKFFERMVPETPSLIENWVGDPVAALKATKAALLRRFHSRLAATPGQPEFSLGGGGGSLERLRSQRLTQ